MIAYLKGTVLEKLGGRLIVDVQGVGYEVAVPVSTYTAIGEAGQPVALRIYTQVREDDISLYGFATPLEKQAFEKLLAVSGIGPSVAVKILSGASVANLVAAIRAGDTVSLTRVPGVGKKTAERIIVELKDKLDDLAPGLPASKATGPKADFSPLESDVLSALLNLGSSPAAAEDAVAKAKKSVTGADFEALFRKALELVR